MHYVSFLFLFFSLVLVGCNGLLDTNRFGSEWIRLMWACPRDTEVVSPTITSITSVSLEDTFNNQQLIDGRIIYYSKAIGFHFSDSDESTYFARAPEGKDYEDYIISQFFAFSLSNGHVLFIYPYRDDSLLVSGEQSASVALYTELEITESQITTSIQNDMPPDNEVWPLDICGDCYLYYPGTANQEFNTTLTVTSTGSGTFSISIDMDEYIDGAVLSFVADYVDQTVTYQFPNYESWREPSSDGSELDFNVYLDGEFVKETDVYDEYEHLCMIDNTEIEFSNTSFLELGTD